MSPSLNRIEALTNAAHWYGELFHSLPDDMHDFHGSCIEVAFSFRSPWPVGSLLQGARCQAQGLGPSVRRQSPVCGASCAFSFPRKRATERDVDALVIADGERGCR